MNFKKIVEFATADKPFKHEFEVQGKTLSVWVQALHSQCIQVWSLDPNQLKDRYPVRVCASPETVWEDTEFCQTVVIQHVGGAYERIRCVPQGFDLLRTMGMFALTMECRGDW